MMGTLDSHQEQSLISYHINLERRVRPDHPLRQLHAALDLSFVVPALKSLYGRSGHVSLDPRVILKRMWLLFYYDIPSERELMAQIGERLDFLWFLGFDLESSIPDHSVLSKARARWGTEVFEQLFGRTVRPCVQAGLVDGRLLHVDSTIVKAHASKNSVLETSPEMVAALRQAYQQQTRKLEVLAPAEPVAPAPASPHLPERGKLPLSQFTYEAGPDRYRCPQGHYLKLHQVKPDAQARVYLIEQAAFCAACPMRPQCTSAQAGRSLQRHVQAEIITRAQKEASSPAGRYSRQRRKHVMEGSFADAANHHGSQRARWRGLARQRLQSWLLCASQNLRLLVQHRQRQPLRGAGARTVLDLFSHRAEWAGGLRRSHPQPGCPPADRVSFSDFLVSWRGKPMTKSVPAF
jgi:transposase